MNTLLKNLGILIIVIGAVILLISFVANLVDYNWLNGGALLLMVIGLIIHIIMNKRIQD